MARRTTGSTSSRSTNQNNGQEAERYRQAAEDALQNLDWAIGYLHGIHKVQISRALARNRAYIRRNLMGKAEEPLPSEKTNET